MEEDEKLEILKLFLKYYEKVTKNVHNHPEFNINKNNHHLFDKNGKIAMQIMKYMGLLNSLTDDLKKVVVFMRRFPNKDFYLENDIDQLSYLKYHYEVFIHKIHTILEVKKLALNNIYEVGLLEKDCSWSNLKSSPKIRKTNTTKIIEAYFKTFSHLIEHRNLNTHRAIFVDKKNEDLSRQNFIYQKSQKLDFELGEDFINVFPKFLLNYEISEYRKEKINYVNDGLKAAEIYVGQFNTIMMNEFLKNLLKNK